MVMESVERLEAVFGQAEGQLESSGSVRDASPLLPFLFSLVPKGPDLVRLCVSDFHAHTWQSDFSVHQLLDLRDEVGIGGSWDDFLEYVRAAFLSNNVKALLGGPANGATTARLVAQKTKGTPRLSLSLTKLEGTDAEDSRLSLCFGMFQAYQKLSSAIQSERAQVSGLRAALAVEQAKVEKLQEQNDGSNLSFPSWKKLNKGRSFQLPGSSSSSQPAILLSSQYETQNIVLPSYSAAPTGTLETKEKASPKLPGPKRVAVIPASRRAKRRGTAFTEDADT